MNKKQTIDVEPRTAYEHYLGKRVSDNHWYGVKRILKQNGFSVDVDNILFYARLQKENKRSSVNALQVFELREKALKLLALDNSKVSGSKVLELLDKEGIKPHMATVGRWFKPLGGFRKNRLYYPEKLVTVITSALLYKLANSTKLEA